MKRWLSCIFCFLLQSCGNGPQSNLPLKENFTRNTPSPLESIVGLNVATNLSDVSISGYQLISRIESKEHVELTFKLIITNHSATTFHNLTAQLTEKSWDGELIDNSVIIGDLYPVTSNVSKTTFTVRVADQQSIRYPNFQWNLKFTPIVLNVIDQLPENAIQRFEELYLTGEFLPQFILGDINSDGKSDRKDQSLLAQYLSNKMDVKLNCMAAGDLNGDAQLDENDVKAFDALFNGQFVFSGTDIPINLPLLYTQPAMPCDLANLFFAAEPAVVAGQTASIFFIDKQIRLEDVVIEVVSGVVEQQANRLPYGLDYITSNSMKVGEKIILKMLIPGRGEFLFALPIQMKIAEFQLTTTVGEDGDDPRDTPPPAIYGEEDNTDDCPLNESGCDVLLIDFFRYGAFYDLDMKTHKLLVPQLTSLGCNVRAVYPRYIRAPVFGNLLTGGGSQNTYINKANLKTLHNINKAIDQHVKALSAGLSLGMQIVLGHGDNIGWGVSFSAPSGPTYGNNPIIARRNLHQKVYKAQYSEEEFRVCGNVALDFSCQSGYTPIIVQSLNNTGSASKTPAKARDHTLHAGYDWNAARGESFIGDDNGSVREGVLASQVKKFSKVLEAEKKARINENHTPPRYKRLRSRIKDYTGSYLSKYMYYVDGGYKDDDLEHAEKLK